MTNQAQALQPRRKKWRPGLELPVSIGVITFYLVTFIGPFLFAIFLAFNNWDFISPICDSI